MSIFRSVIKKWWFWPLLFGILIRLLLMPITLHPDLWGHSFTAYFFSHKGVINIYEYLLSLPANHPLVKNFGVGDIFIYPPLTYFTLGLFRFLVRPLTDPNFIPWLMENLGSIYNYKGLYWHLMLFKFPYIFVDVAAAFVIRGLFKSLRAKKLVFILWIFNPLTLYATFMVGQLDLIPTFFTILSLYFASKKRHVLSVFSLGVGGSYKMYPLLLIIPASLAFSKNLKERIKYIFLGFLPFLATITPYIGSPAFRQMVLFSPKSQKMLFMGLAVSGAEVVFPFILFLIFIYYFAYYARDKFDLNSYFLTITLLIFSVTHYHPQWFLWTTPFLIIELVRSGFKHLPIVLALLCSWLFITLTFEPSLSVGLFNPLVPSLSEVKGLTDFLSSYTDVYQLKSIVRSIFAGSSLYYILALYKNKTVVFS